MSRTLKSSVAAMLCVGAIAGCSGATSLPDLAVRLTVLEDTVRAIRDSTHITLELRLQVENRDAQPVFVGPCGHVLYQRTASADRPVYSVPCRGGSALNIVVEPGLGSTISMRVVVRRDTVVGRWPAVGVEGDYYVVAWLLSSPGAGGIAGVPLPQGRRTSPPFPVRERDAGRLTLPHPSHLQDMPRQVRSRGQRSQGGLFACQRKRHGAPAFAGATNSSRRTCESSVPRVV